MELIISEDTDLFDKQLTPNHNPMDPILYMAAKNGSVEHLDQHTDLFDNQVTPNQNTILHVAAHFGKSECVAKILEKKPCLILRVNSNGENPLHIAVREQHLNTVQALLNCARYLHQDLESSVPLRQQILRATNEDGDTPLHLAVREGDNSLVSLLANQDLDFKHCPNKAGESPLYLAAERNNGDSMIESILACESPAYTGPRGRTALHAAAISGNIESIKKLLNQNTELIDMADEQGWTPLHYAAYCGDKNAVRELLARNKSVGYIRATEKHDNGIALHIAAAAGNEYVIEEILSHCPDCWEMVNSKGQNILHIAVERKAECIIDYIIKTDWLGSLMNQKDAGGNTPLHLLASSEMKDMDEVINHRRANMYVVNNQNKTPVEVAMWTKQNNRSSWFKKARGWRNIGSNEEHKAKMTEDFLMESVRKERNKNESKTSHNLMLVATLIATVTFATGVAIPVGYEAKQGSEEGMAVLVRKAGFKAFILANTIAVMCSTSSVLCYVFAALYDNDDNQKARSYMNGFTLVLSAIVAMMVGFLSGTYAMLVHFLGLAIATAVIASISFLIYFSELRRFILYIKFQGLIVDGNY